MKARTGWEGQNKELQNHRIVEFEGHLAQPPATQEYLRGVQETGPEHSLGPRIQSEVHLGNYHLVETNQVWSVPGRETVH